ncbi:MAG: hypothetical protein LBB67_06950 [Oscillospiraceae bacterium]|jgi:hypothetical protein|nr:hypothetical protein [Oscillospiraceae bacterium]
MKPYRRFFAALFAVLLIVGLFAACQPKEESPEIIASPEGTDDAAYGWKPVVPTTSGVAVSAPLSQQQIRQIIDGVLANTRATGGGAWDGNYASLTPEEKEQIAEEIKTNTGYDVVVSNDGIVYEQNATSASAEQGTQDPTGANNAASTAKPGSEAKTTKSTGTTVPIYVETTGGGNISFANTTQPAAPAAQLVGASRTQLKAFGGKGHQRLMKGVVTPNGGYLAIAYVDASAPDAPSGTPEPSSCIIQYSPTGEVEWKVYYTFDGPFELRSIAVLRDGSIIAVGDSLCKNLDGLPSSPTVDSGYRDAVIVKLDANGNKLWMKTFYGSLNDQFHAVAATPDGGFVVGGTTVSSDYSFAGTPDFMDTVNGHVPVHKAIIMKFDKDAETVYWQRMMYGSKISYVNTIAVEPSTGDVYYSIATMAGDGSFAGVAGMGQTDTVLVRTSKNGDTHWVKPFASLSTETFAAIVPAHDGGVVAYATISTSSYGSGSFPVGSLGDDFSVRGLQDTMLLKYNPDGSVAWLRTIGDTCDDVAQGLVAIDGGYVAVGYSKALRPNTEYRYDWLDAGYGGGDQDGFAVVVQTNGTPVKFIPVNGNARENMYAIAGKGRSFALIGSTASDENYFADIGARSTGLNHVGFVAIYSAQWNG